MQQKRNEQSAKCPQADNVEANKLRRVILASSWHSVHQYTFVDTVSEEKIPMSSKIDFLYD